MRTDLSQPVVSVIVPVYGDDGGLERCAERLRSQDYPGELLEFVIVDNGGNPDFSTLSCNDSRFRIVREDIPGSYAARNTGLQAARGSVVAFTDADCLPVSDWISRGVAMLGRFGDDGLVGGRIEFVYAQPMSPTIVELYDSMVNLDQERYIAENHYSVTANLFASVRVFETVGPFDSRLRSGGDREWGERAHRAGFPLRYAADAVILHPARRSFRECAIKARRVSGGNVARLRSKGELSDGRSVARFVLQGLMPPVAQLRQVVRRDPGIPYRKLIPLALVMTLFKYVRTIEALRVLVGGVVQR